MPAQELPAIALVSDEASLRMGPDAARALHYFRALRDRDLDVHLVCRERHRAELGELLAGDEERVHYVGDPSGASWLSRFALLLPRELGRGVEGAARLARQRARRRQVSQLVRRNGVRIVHQVTPARPGATSRIYGLGVPVVMGPLTEPCELPPGFRAAPGRARQLGGRAARLGSFLCHLLFPGRRRAEVLLVSDARSSRAVPAGARGRKLRLTADALDLRDWKAPEQRRERDAPEILLAGRLGPDSGAEHLLDAFRLCLDAHPARLRIVGDGPLRERLEQRAEALDLGDRVEWSGWLAAEARRRALERADVFAYPELRGEDAGVLMEAMALGLPVVATDWGAASELAGDGVGLLVGPRTREQFTRELARALHRLVESPTRRRELGQQAARHAAACFDWRQRVDRLLDVYRLAAS